MSSSPTKYLIDFQRFICVFRNFRNVKKRYQFLMSVLITTEITTTIYNLYYNQFFHEMLKPLNILAVYYFLAMNFSIALTILAVHHSRKFQRLLKNCDCDSSLFGDNTYSKKLKTKRNILKLIITLYCGLQFLTFLFLRIINYNLKDNLITMALLDLNVFLCDFRLMYEHIVIHSLLYTFSEQLNSITRSIDDEAKKYCNKIIEDRGITSKLGEIHLNKFDLWMSAHKFVNYNIELFNEIFNTEVSISFRNLQVYFALLHILTHLYLCLLHYILGSINTFTKYIYYYVMGKGIYFQIYLFS